MGEEDDRRILHKHKQLPGDPPKALSDIDQRREPTPIPKLEIGIGKFVLPVLALIISLTGPIALWKSCKAERLQHRIAVENLIDEAWDYLGGKEGNPYPGTVQVGSQTVMRAMQHTYIKTRKIEQRQINLALRKITEALNRKADNPDAIRLRGVILQLSGQSGEAIREFERAIDLDPTNAKNYNALAIGLFNLRHYDHAVTQLEKAIKLDTSASYLHNNLGMVYFAAENFPDAFGCFKKAVQLDLEDSTSRCNLGAILDYMGRPEEAIEELSRAVFLDTKSSEAHFNSGVVRMKLGKIDEAITCFETTIGLDPAHSYAHYNLASCFLKKGKTEDAIKLLDRAIYIDPNYLAAYGLLASLYTEKGELEKANKLKEQATTIEKRKGH